MEIWREVRKIIRKHSTQRIPVAIISVLLNIRAKMALSMGLVSMLLTFPGVFILYR